MFGFVTFAALLLTAGGQTEGGAGAGMQPAVGSWMCSGTFASGTPISANATFTSVANGAAIVSTYDDVPPGQYHAAALFGMTAKGAQIESLIDASSGQRSFHGVPVAGGIDYVNDDGSDRFAYRFGADSTLDIEYVVIKAGMEHPVDSLHCVHKASAAP